MPDAARKVKWSRWAVLGKIKGVKVRAASLYGEEKMEGDVLQIDLPDLS